MDKSQKGPPGWNITDSDGGPEINLGPEAMLTRAETVARAQQVLEEAFARAVENNPVLLRAMQKLA